MLHIKLQMKIIRNKNCMDTANDHFVLFKLSLLIAYNPFQGMKIIYVLLLRDLSHKKIKKSIHQNCGHFRREHIAD